MRRWGALVLVGLLLTGCMRGSADRDERAGDDLTPTFDALPDEATTETTTSTATGSGGPTSTTTGAQASTTTVRPDGQVTPPAVPGATTAAIVDRQGDLTPSPADPPPAWADLVGGTLIRRADGFELRVRLAGGSAPTSIDEDHTMNVASFYDVDGNGDIDFEVWANLAARGWGVSWFDNDKELGYFGERTRVGVTVEGAEVVLRFPLSRLGGAERFRWSLASEWGRYAALGTSTTARDDAPDDDGAASFPG